jgi:hypothetical protein
VGKLPCSGTEGSSVFDKALGRAVGLVWSNRDPQSLQKRSSRLRLAELPGTRPLFWEGLIFSAGGAAQPVQTLGPFTSDQDAQGLIRPHLLVCATMPILGWRW